MLYDVILFILNLYNLKKKRTLVQRFKENYLAETQKHEGK